MTAHISIASERIGHVEDKKITAAKLHVDAQVAFSHESMHAPIRAASTKQPSPTSVEDSEILQGRVKLNTMFYKFPTK